MLAPDEGAKSFHETPDGGPKTLCWSVKCVLALPHMQCQYCSTGLFHGGSSTENEFHAENRYSCCYAVLILQQYQHLMTCPLSQWPQT